MHENSFTALSEVINPARDGACDGKTAAAGVLEFGIRKTFQLACFGRDNRLRRGRRFGGRDHPAASWSQMQELGRWVGSCWLRLGRADYWLRHRFGRMR